MKLVGLADSGGRGKSMVSQGMIKVDGVHENRKTAKIRQGQIVECAEGQDSVIITIITDSATHFSTGS